MSLLPDINKDGEISPNQTEASLDADKFTISSHHDSNLKSRIINLTEYPHRVA